MKPSLLLEGFTTTELVAEVMARGETPSYFQLAGCLDWLQQNAPLALWKGTKADGTPMFEILKTDGDGMLAVDSDGEYAIVLSTGTDLASAINDARNPEREQ